MQIKPNPPTTYANSPEYTQFNVWIQVEFAFFGGTFVAYVLFFIIRSFLEQRVLIEYEIMENIAGADFIFAQ